MAKILYVDIETAPNLAYVWGFFKANVGVNQLKSSEYIMAFSALWNDGDDAIYMENRGQDEKALVKKLIELFDEADIIIGHNVHMFDRNFINGRALILGIDPPSPYQIVDTYKIAKNEFRFRSNSLDFLCKVLDVKNKKLHHKKFPGFSLWAACLRNDEDAWKEMKDYNIMDSFAVREVYKKMLPWIRNHPNIANIDNAEQMACPKCGSVHIQKRGFTHTSTGKYQRYVCLSCGGWSRSRFCEPKEEPKNLLVNAR